MVNIAQSVTAFLIPKIRLPEIMHCITCKTFQYTTIIHRLFTSLRMNFIMSPLWLDDTCSQFSLPLTRNPDSSKCKTFSRLKHSFTASMAGNIRPDNSSLAFKTIPSDIRCPNKSNPQKSA